MVNNRVLVAVDDVSNDAACMIVANDSGATGATGWDSGTTVGCSFPGCTSSTPPEIVGNSVGASIAVEPNGVTVSIGETATFLVTAEGSGPLSYQWQRNSSDIAGATGVAYGTLDTTSLDDGAVFTVRVSNAVESVVKSSQASLTVK